MRSNFKAEIKKQVRFAIAAAIGFMIAFAWRNFIIELTQNWVNQISTFTNMHFLNFSTALLITLIGVILIIISSKILKNP